MEVTLPIGGVATLALDFCDTHQRVYTLIRELWIPPEKVGGDSGAFHAVSGLILDISSALHLCEPLNPRTCGFRLRGDIHSAGDLVHDDPPLGRAPALFLAFRDFRLMQRKVAKHPSD